MLSMNFVKNKGHACGASILTKHWALTAAHCCKTGYEMYLYSGSNSLTKGGTNHEIELYKVHEDYMPNDMWKNDICLMKVKNPFVFGPKVQQITLPPQGWQLDEFDFVNITGWGYTKPDVEDIPDKLQLGKNFLHVTPAKCKAKTGQSHESYLCAQGVVQGQGVCNGDSGSPLVKNGVQVGIASWVYIPCGCGFPDFYARVSVFINWISNTLGKDAVELKFKKP